jgi:hypothetical protein
MTCDGGRLEFPAMLSDSAFRTEVVALNRSTFGRPITITHEDTAMPEEKREASRLAGALDRKGKQTPKRILKNGFHPVQVDARIKSL